MGVIENHPALAASNGEASMSKVFERSFLEGALQGGTKTRRGKRPCARQGQTPLSLHFVLRRGRCGSAVPSVGGGRAVIIF